MPPPRRHAGAASPYTTRGWLSRCCRCRPPRNKRRRGGVDPLAALPDDLLAGSILPRAFTDAADVARCAAVCRRWGRAVAARAAAIARALPPPGRLLPHLALGFFHGEKRRRHLVASRFVPTASASRLLGPPPLPAILLPEDGGCAGAGGRSLFDRATPVASRNGRVVLELRREAHADGLTLAVCNPMTGTVAVLPPLAGVDCPGPNFACALLTEEDQDLDYYMPPRSPGFFRLLLVYNRRSFTALRSYSSDAAGAGAGGWGPEGRKPGAKMSGHMLRHLGPAVVIRGVAYWAMHRAALGVRLDGGAAPATTMVPYRLRHYLPDYRLLGVTPDGRLSYVCAAVSGGALRFLVETLELRGVDGDQSTARDGWERRECIHLPEFKVSTTTELKLRWLGEKSGMLFFTIGEGGSTSGAFVLNLVTSSVEKLANGVECNSWRNLCGYEMDCSALIASVAVRFY
ncbi:hypothetical protein ACP70R_032215 [Stipagrostis hirtigluma subsp. patula]